MVHVDGSLTTCCLDEGMQNKLGNLKETPLNTLWNGKTINQWRRAQIEGKFDQSGPLCSHCNWKSAGAYPAEKVKEWLAKQSSKK